MIDDREEALEPDEPEGREAEAEAEEPSSPQPEAEPAAEPAVDPAVVEQARKYGWKGPDEWQGAPPKKGFMRPDEYLELPGVQNRILREQMEETRKEFADRVARIERVNEQARERERKAHQAEVERIKQAQRQAVEAGDVAEYEALEKRREALGTVPQQPQQADSEVEYIQGWIAALPQDHWWRQDEELRAASGVIYNKAPAHFTPQQKVAFVEQRIRERFMAPEPKKPARPVRVDGGGLAGGGRQKPSEKLPPEAKAAGDRFVRDGLFKNLDEYAKVYFEDV